MKINLIKRISKNFSLFSKLKTYIKSGVQSTFLSNKIDPEKIRVIYEEDEQVKSEKIKEKEIEKEEQKQIKEALNKITETEKTKITKEIIDKDKEEQVALKQQEEIIKSILEKIESAKHKIELNSMELRQTTRTIWERINSYEVSEDGKAMSFENIERYNQWKSDKENNLKQNIKEKLNPQEYYITQEIGCERPFTGQYWDSQGVGIYSCVVCTQRIFSSTHKYQNPTGHASFWNFLPFSLNFKEDNVHYPTPTQAIQRLQYANSKPSKRICCSNCDAHLGLLFEDGPAPFFKRLMINSSAVKFVDYGWNESPDDIALKEKLRQMRLEAEKIRKETSVISNLEKEFKPIVEYLKEHQVKFEKEIDLDVLNKKIDEFQNTPNKIQTNI